MHVPPGKIFIGRVPKHNLLRSDTSFLKYYFSLVEVQTMQYFYLKIPKQPLQENSLARATRAYRYCNVFSFTIQVVTFNLNVQ